MHQYRVLHRLAFSLVRMQVPCLEVASDTLFSSVLAKMLVEDPDAHKFRKRPPKSGNRNNRATMVSQSKKPVSSRGSASDQFPGKLHDLMTFIEMEGLTDIISWVRNGQAIMVHDSDRLLKLLPIFGLSQTKYRSFERQL